jgi:quinol monooxygenase YgiN
MDPMPVQLTIVTMIFDATDEAGLAAALARYVVMARQHPGCRNIDLCTSLTRPGRFLVIEKWENPEAQQAHFSSADMVEFAHACEGRLARPPDIDLFEGISAHDLS